ncbi:energy-coupling factor transporter transmembrane component T [Neobacillus sp. NPDC058068]|uniref:energy-coupling factor transporter transmembrane component T n=1 Tax=Neobacillus sp. NPDC058068 TaxID=3346325 RepID=UPI0036D92217
MSTSTQNHHPFIHLLYYGCVGLNVMLFLHPIFLITAIILLLLINLLHGNKEKVKKSFPFFIVMGLIVMILNPFFVHRGSNILFYFRDNPITLEALLYGVVMAFMLISILVLFLSFNHVLNGRKFMFLFSKVWPQLGLLLMLTIRFVPLFIRRWREIYEVQKVRNYSMSQGTVKTRAKVGMLYMQKLLTWSLEEALQSAESMKARGYGLSRKRTSYQTFLMTAKEWGMMIVLLGLTMIGIVGAKQKHGVLTIYPELGTLTFTSLDWLYYGIFFLLVSFPLIVEGGEQLRWRISR